MCGRRQRVLREYDYSERLDSECAMIRPIQRQEDDENFVYLSNFPLGLEVEILLLRAPRLSVKGLVKEICFKPDMKQRKSDDDDDDYDDDDYKCKKMWFRHQLTANDTSKTAKITKM